MVDIKKVNIWAKLSCSRWDKIPPLRRYFRKKYRKQAEEYLRSKDHLEKMKQYLKGNIIDTYPYPYCDPEFANWDESDAPNDYTLISDQSGFVVKYASSYVAYKIFESVGKWPMRTVAKRYDAWDWEEFLRDAGYSEISTQPKTGCVGVLREDAELKDSNPEIREYGLVVWAEKVIPEKERVIVSTYLDKRFTTLNVDKKDFVWVVI